MKINRVLAAVAIVFSLLAIGYAAPPKKQNHHNGHQLIAGKLKADGRHNIDKKGHYTAAVDSKGGKIAAFHVVHDTKGEIAVKKYKSNKKMAQAAAPHLIYSSLELVQDTDMGTVYIGYSYVDDYGNEEIYWFPEEEILDGDTGAIVYVPLS